MPPEQERVSEGVHFAECSAVAHIKPYLCRTQLLEISMRLPDLFLFGRISPQLMHRWRRQLTNKDNNHPPWQAPSWIQICSEGLRHGVTALAISESTVEERHRSLLLLGVEALFKPLSPSRAVRQSYLLTGYYPAAVQDTQQREGTVWNHC